MSSSLLTKLDNRIKKFLKIDYPRSKATGYFANFLSLRATRISNGKKDNKETPE
jgi:hypothetical protein